MIVFGYYYILVKKTEAEVEDKTRLSGEALRRRPSALQVQSVTVVLVASKHYFILKLTRTTVQYASFAVKILALLLYLFDSGIPTHNRKV